MTGGMRAVIPAAGFGTRMLPATKSMPKEMMPILDKPTIQYVLDEATAAGIDEVVIVTGRHKRAVEDHFDSSPDLEQFLEKAGKAAAIEQLRTVGPATRLFYIRQDRPQGLGHAVLQAAPLVRDAPFVVMLGDDILVGNPSALSQLQAAHQRFKASVLLVQEVPSQDVSKYGIVQTEPLGNGLHRVVDIVEKPEPAVAPSRMAVVGRYLLTPSILPILAKIRPGRGGEIQLTDAIHDLLKQEPVYAVEFGGHRFDVGNLAGWLDTNLHFARQRPELRAILEGAASGPSTPAAR